MGRYVRLHPFPLPAGRDPVSIRYRYLLRRERRRLALEESILAYLEDTEALASGYTVAKALGIRSSIAAYRALGRLEAAGEIVAGWEAGPGPWRRLYRRAS
jgi:DNA-binding PadR family transcriptional regulator